MADVRLGRAIINFFADTGRFTNDVRKAGAALTRQERVVRQLRATYRRTRQAAQQFLQTQLSLRNAVGLLVGGGGFGLLIKRNLEAADAIFKAARAAGSAPEQYQALGEVFNFSGLTALQFNKALVTLNRRVAVFNTTGGGPLLALFKSLNREQVQSIITQKDSVQQFIALTKVSSQLADVQQRRALFTEAFDKRIGILLAGNLPDYVTIQRQVNEAIDEGRVLSGRFAPAIEEINDEYLRLTNTLSVAFTSALFENRQELLEFIQALRRDLPGAIQVAVEVIDLIREHFDELLITLLAIKGAQIGALLGPKGAIIGGLAAAAGGAFLLSDSTATLREEVKAFGGDIDALTKATEESQNRINTLRERAIGGPVGFDPVAAQAFAQASQKALAEEETRLTALQAALSNARKAAESFNDAQEGTPPVVQAATRSVAGQLEGLQSYADFVRRLTQEIEIQRVRASQQIEIGAITTPEVGAGLQARFDIENQIAMRQRQLQQQLIVQRRKLETDLSASARVGVETRIRAIEEEFTAIEQNLPVLQEIARQREMDATAAFRQIESLNMFRELIETTLTPLEEYNYALQRQFELLSSGAISADQFNQVQAALQENLDTAVVDQFREGLANAASTVRNLGNAVEGEFGKILNNIASAIDLINSLSDAFSSISKLIESFSGGGGGGDGFLGAVGTFLGGFGGGKQGGGPVRQGQAYLVGETGPELFVPGQGGQVVSNDALNNIQQGGTVVNNSYTINGGDELGTERALQRTLPIISASQKRAFNRDAKRASDVSTSIRGNRPGG